MRSELPTEVLEQAEDQVGICSIFNNPQRVLILWLLAERKRTAIELAYTIGISLQELFKHLQVMGFRNLIVSCHEENNIYYSVPKSEILDKCTILTSRPLDKRLEVSVV